MHVIPQLWVIRHALPGSLTRSITKMFAALHLLSSACRFHTYRMAFLLFTSFFFALSRASRHFVHQLLHSVPYKVQLSYKLTLFHGSRVWSFLLHVRIKPFSNLLSMIILDLLNNLPGFHLSVRWEFYFFSHHSYFVLMFSKSCLSSATHLLVDF